ncbi:SpoIID/LytB domain-containing protein [Lachnoclostridium phytofermentans]|uniref:SpoIID/LytB domain-containing protein n=1 Tax=Lachnoclostridium phytofermentans TaxID=66219 RepID=UPI000550F879|nr:SpoIID/LytB domain-containing protein [Lachnoclostridium phytofermentans]
MNKKEWIKKLILAGICIVIFIILLFRNILGGTKDNDGGEQSNTLQGERITRAEAMRLFSYLFYTSEERKELSFLSEFSDVSAKEEYSEYLNAAINAGFVSNATKEDKKARLLENITCGEFRDMLFMITDLYEIDYNGLKKSFPDRFSTVREKDELLLTEFLSIYETMISMLKGKTKLSYQELYFLGSLSEAGDNLLAQDGNQYQTTYFRNYQDLFQPENEPPSKAIPFRGKENKDDYVGRYLSVLTCADELVYVRAQIDKPVVLKNVYMIEGKGKEIKTFISGITRTFETSLTLSDSFTEKVGDLTLTDGLITSVTIKPDIIRGKVLVTGKNEIEVEGYGVLPLDDNYRIYKLFGEMEMEKTNNILVGYSVTDFVVSEGKICAALIRDQIKAENIRVLINSSNYQSVYHDSIIFTVDCPYTIDNGEETVRFEKDEEFTITKDSKLMTNGRIKITPLEEHGKVALLNVKRNLGVPKYRGTMEISVNEKGLIVINELSIEEYLYAVVPSEMPVSYGNEALKVQAVCARSYAFNQLYANKYSAYGAHVDDSVSCQVYNNVAENDASIMAVKDTYGKVLTQGGKVITAYYFSTSCGHTASIEDVWQDAKEAKYLTGNLQTEERMTVDFSKDEVFRGFLAKDEVSVMTDGTKKEEAVTTYDSGFLMYRWNVTMDVATLSKQINKYLADCYNSNKTSILTYVRSQELNDATEIPGATIVEGKVFKSIPVSTIGTLADMKVITRGSSGIIKELLIKGTENTVLVRYQTNIRKLLAPVATEVVRLDGSTVNGMSLLPSAFFVIDKSNESSKTTFTLTGGGFGHGTGMSQNGVKTMVSRGKSYEEILKHYYTDANLEVIYE